MMMESERFTASHGRGAAFMRQQESNGLLTFGLEKVIVK